MNPVGRRCHIWKGTRVIAEIGTQMVTSRQRPRPDPMRRAGGSVPLIALLIALCIGPARAAVSATYEVVDAQLSFLPSYPPQFVTAGVVSITADEPIYVHAGKCQFNNVCNEKNIVPCCKVRGPLTRLSVSRTPPLDL